VTEDSQQRLEAAQGEANRPRDTDERLERAATATRVKSIFVLYLLE